MAVTEQQVRIYMSQREDGRTQQSAAARAGISERTARRLEREGGGRSKTPRHWRTRADPFATVWESELVGQLEAEPDLSALTLLEWLQERHPGEYPDALLRTLQRRVKAWRARFGPDKEVMFPQVHGPGERALSDFTLPKDIEIRIAGERLEHRLYHFRLAYSGWCHVRAVLGGESFPALAEGMTEALERLGGVPAEHRTDSLSAAFRNLDAEAEADLAERYRALCAHYGMRASRNNRGRGHENGSIEAPHGHFKRRLRQRLALRGSVEFDSLADYQRFLEAICAGINRRNAKRIAVEHAALAPLPCQRGVDYTEAIVRVTSSSTITLRHELYSVPARLIGERLRVHIYDNRLVLHHGGVELLTLERLRPGKGQGRQRRIDYRHVISSLARKPRALAGLAFRDELLPGPAWRTIYQHLAATLESAAACKRVVGALAIAAEQDCAERLGAFWLAALERGESPTLAALQHRFCPPSSRTAASLSAAAPAQHPLRDYDALLPTRAASEEEPCHG